MSSSGPPELPGLMSALVCMKSLKTTSPRWVTDRFLAERIPVVAELESPKGFPSAIVVSPTYRRSLSPIRAYGKGPPDLILRIATSLFVSGLMRAASRTRPAPRSGSVTVMRSDPRTTW
jgi:hypothetical protein